MPHPVIEAAQRYRQNLLDNERQSATRLVAAYGRAYVRMGDSIAQLEARLAAGVDSEFYRTRIEALRSLRLQTVDEINRFAVYADQEITANARAAIAQGIADSGRIVGEYAGNNAAARQALSAGWDMLPAESVETMLGFLAPDSPLHTRLVGILGETVAQRMETALTDAITLGFNPRKTAEIARRELGVGLTWALNTARTAQMYAYREATRANYMANSDVVSGWTWYATLSRRTCMSCLAQHGTRHPVTETLNDHHAGRCVAIPNVRLAGRLGINMPEIESGEQWFRRQPESIQMEMMGPGMFDAWQLNQFNFKDLSQPYQDTVYGTMLRQSSLKDLLSRGAPPPFGGGGRPPSGQETPTPSDLERARLAGEQKRREEEMQRRVALEKERLRQEREAAAREALRLRQEQVEREAAAARAMARAQDGGASATRARIVEIADTYQPRIDELKRDAEKMQTERGALLSLIGKLEINAARRAGTPQEQQLLATLEQKRSEQAALSQRVLANRRQQNALTAEMDGKISPLLTVSNPARATLRSGGEPDATVAAWQTGLDQFNRMVSADIVPPGSIPFRGQGDDFAAHYDTNDKTVNLGRKAPPGIVAHELMHWLEDHNPEILQKQLDFFNRRTAGETTTQLDKNNANIVGKRDKFIVYYMGREYVYRGVHVATEIGSMGLEYMIERPTELAGKDPDMFDFIFDLLRGR